MWRALTSYLPFIPIINVDNATAASRNMNSGDVISASLQPTVYIDSDGDIDVIAMPKVAGVGYRFSTLSASGKSDSADEGDQAHATDNVNTIDVFAFEKNGYCCASSVLTPSARVALSGAFKLQVQFTDSQFPQIPPLKVQDFNELYWYAFSPYGDHAFAGKDKHSKLASWTFHKPGNESVTKPSYTSLTQWLTAHLPHESSALAKSSLVFGTGASYFAKTEKLCTWNDLPDILDEFLRSKGAATIKDGTTETIPRVVALGAEDTHVAIMKDGSSMWQLNRKHFLRMKIAEGVDLNTWEYVALNPHNSRDYFLATKAGSVDIAIEALDSEGSVSLSTTLLTYMQAKAKEDQRKYEVQIKAGEGMADISITPTSRWGRFEIVDGKGATMRR